MKKLLILMLGSSLLSGCVTSPNTPTPLPPRIEESAMVLPRVPTKAEFLQSETQEVRQALAVYEKTGHAPTITTSHTITMPFDDTTPTIECSPLRACDIALEKSEKVTGVFPGDTARWLFEQAMSGEGDAQQMHVIFKPKADGIETNAVITTTKRTYHLELRSKNAISVKEIAFYYPEEFESQWKQLQQNANLLRQSQQAEMAAQKNRWQTQSLNFHYRIESPLLSDKPIWTPVRVFNDGVHVYIQLPDQAATTSLPALFTVGPDDQPVLVNYRVKKPYYIVDALFQKAILESGVGQNQQRVTITYSE